MSMVDTNPRAVIGGNKAPDYAKLEQERLAAEYVGYTNTLADLTALAEARDVEIPDDADADAAALEAGAIIKRFRDLDKRIEETRVVEGEPHLRRKNACDAFFKGLRNIIQPEDRQRRTKPGWIDRLQARINAHQDRKEARERARLEAESLERQRVAREAEEKAQRDRDAAEALRREEERKRAEADRARKPENIEAKTEEANQAGAFAAAKESAAAASTIAAEQATAAAQEARIATLAKPADIVRTRGVTNDGAGVTLTKAKEKYSILADRDAMDDAAYARLGPFFTDDAVQTALNKFARATNYREPMAGAEIGERTKGVTR
jgi:chemotaxis protein histidine kinase CheA